MKRITPCTNEIYHIYNRGVDKRNIFGDKYDVLHLYRSLKNFNTIEPIGSLFRLDSMTKKPPCDELVYIHSYHLLGNHFHLLLEQKIDGGISEFMKRIGGGYTGFFNEKNERSGSLFQGKYKLAHIDTNEKYMNIFAYITYNDIVHNSSFPCKIPSDMQNILSCKHQFETNSNGLCVTNRIPNEYLTKKFLQEAQQLAREVYEMRKSIKYTLE